MNSLLEALKENPELLKDKRLLKRTALKDTSLTTEQAVDLLKAYDLDIIEDLSAPSNPLTKAAILNKFENAGMSKEAVNWAYSFWEETLNTLGLMQTGQEQFPKVPETMDSVPLPIPEILLDFEDTDDENYYINPCLPKKENGIYIPCGIGNTDHGFFIYGIAKTLMCENPAGNIFALVYQYLTRNTVIRDQDIPAILKTEDTPYQLDYKSIFRLTIILLQMVRHNCVKGNTLTFVVAPTDILIQDQIRNLRELHRIDNVAHLKLTRDNSFAEFELVANLNYITPTSLQCRHLIAQFHHINNGTKTVGYRHEMIAAGPLIAYEKHDLPIRLKLLPSDFELELGLLGVPASDLQELQDHKIQITPIGRNADPLSYALKERLSENEISYVLIGTIPYPEYQIQLDCRSIRAFSCWPERIRGIESPGALFDAVTRKKLPYDADVQLGKNYYLLQSGMLNGGCSSVRLKQIRSRSVPGNCWRLYEVSAIALDVDAAKFFLQFHCRLTDQAVSIQPIWPIYTKSPYVIHHNAREMIFHVKGDVHTKSSPYARQRPPQPLDGGGVLEYIQCSVRQQLISSGHDYLLNARDFWRRLKYTYLWKEPLEHTTEEPTVVVTDITGQPLLSGEVDKLPSKSAIRISAPYDGTTVIKFRGEIIERRPLKAEVPIEIDSLQFGYAIEVFQGLDLVWCVQYQRKSAQSDLEEDQIMRRLKNASGPSVVVPHAWGSAAEHLGKYPQIKQWLYQRIRKGSMPLQAYREFSHFIENL